MDIDADVEGAVAIAEDEDEAPGMGSGGPAIIGSIFGRKVELISPMPTKKSSVCRKLCSDYPEEPTTIK